MPSTNERTARATTREMAIVSSPVSVGCVLGTAVGAASPRRRRARAKADANASASPDYSRKPRGCENAPSCRVAATWKRDDWRSTRARAPKRLKLSRFARTDPVAPRPGTSCESRQVARAARRFRPRGSARRGGPRPARRRGPGRTCLATRRRFVACSGALGPQPSTSATGSYRTGHDRARARRLRCACAIRRAPSLPM